jgi:hypothetical protein
MKEADLKAQIIEALRYDGGKNVTEISVLVFDTWTAANIRVKAPKGYVFSNLFEAMEKEGWKFGSMKIETARRVLLFFEKRAPAVQVTTTEGPWTAEISVKGAEA